MAKKQQKYSQKFDLSESWLPLLPLLFIVAIIPLIVFAKEVTLVAIEQINWHGKETSLDFFSYYKAQYFVWTVFLTALGVLFLSFFKKFEIKRSKYYIPLLVYLVFVFLSYLFSEHKVIAGRGFVDLFQGVWVMLAYGVVVILVINLVRNEKQIKYLLASYIFVGLATAFLGLGQYFGHDLLKTEFGKLLVLPQHLHYIVDKIGFTFGDKTIYATMYNTNFVGSFAALLLPLSAGIFLFVEGWKKIIPAGIFMVLMGAVLIGSNSRAGIVGSILGFAFLILLFRKNLKSNFKKLGSILAIFVIFLLSLNFYSHGSVMRELSSLNLSNEAERITASALKTSRMENITLDGKTAIIETDKENLIIKVVGNKLLFENTEGKKLSIKTNENIITFTDEKYSDYQIEMIQKQNLINIKAYSHKFYLLITNDGFKMPGANGNLGGIQTPPRLEFMDGYEKFASSRGYIWSRSVPMLKDTLLIGHGPDTFAINFPQRDYVGKLNAFNNENMIVDKPHNMYLQIGINTGVISLLALVAVYLMYFIDSMKLYWQRKQETFLEFMGVAVFTGVMAYLGAAFFNDQIISVAPLFYVMVGVGIVINSMVKKGN